MTLPPQQARDQGGVDDQFPSVDAMYRVDERGDVGDPVLEQVAAGSWQLLEQPHRVAGLDVLGQHQHADIRVGGTDGRRRAETFVGEGGRHPDVDDQDVGRVGRDDRLEGGCVSEPVSDFHPGVL